MFFLQTYVVNERGGENTPKFNKEYLWKHWTNLDDVNTIWCEISSSFLLFKNFLCTIYIYVYFLNTTKYNFNLEIKL